MNDKIVHLRSTCSGMNNPEVHFLPYETVKLFRWCGGCAGYGAGVEMANFCSCCSAMLGPGTRQDMVRYSRHAFTSMVNHDNPVGRHSSCNEHFQRKVLLKLKEYHQSRRALAMAGRAGPASVVGDFVGRMMTQNGDYFAPHFD